MLIVRDFTGNLNMDVSPYRTPAQDFIDALNITRNTPGDYTDGPVSMLVGNQEVVYALPAGTNQCIGAYADALKRRVVFFVWNSGGFHSILKYSYDTNSITKILESKTDSDGTDILNFRQLYKVNDINIVYADDGDLLFFNDGFNRPGGLNIVLLETGYYTPVPDYVIRLAKMPAPSLITATYESDTLRKVNALKKKLFQFAQAIETKDNYRSVWSTSYSKLPIPVDAFTASVESDPAQNNVINLQLTSGGVDYQRILIAGRIFNGNIWGDWFLIDSLDRDTYNIPPGSTYNYKFINDGQYPFLEQREVDLKFDYIPDVAGSSTIANGNVLLYANNTDGYPHIPRSQINVQLSSSLVDTAGNGGTPASPSITYFQGVGGGDYYIYFLIGLSVAEGCVYNIKFRGPVRNGPDFNVDVTYTAIASDTATTVAAALVALITPQLVTFPSSVMQGPTYPYQITVDNNQSGSQYPYDNIVVSAQPFIRQSGGTSTWNWSTTYRACLIYEDSRGKIIDVVSFVSNDDDPNDFSFTTPNFAISLTPGDSHFQPQIPVVYAAINHLPPPEAVSFQWGFTPNLIVASFLYYITCKYEFDANYQYFCIENLYKFRTDNTGFVPGYTFTPGDRIRIIVPVNTLSVPPEYNSGYGGAPYNIDYEILGVVSRPYGTEEGETATFIKVYSELVRPVFFDDLFVEIYTPSLRTGDKNGTVFYGRGEKFPIYTGADNIRYHVGGDQNQTASQPATFSFEDGDVYYKFRTFYKPDFSPETAYQLGIIDANYSDYWPSAANSNGRPYVIERDAKRITNPVEIRFGQAFQPGTKINGLNRFYAEDFIEVIRNYGTIERIFPWNNAIMCMQNSKIGAIPVLQQMTFNVDGSSNLILSSNLLNRIQYYKGEYGIGTLPESLAYNNDAVFFCDNIRGVICRISPRGLEPISILKNVNNFAVTQLKVRGFDFKVYGVLDTYNNIYVSALEATETIPYKTLSFNEDRNGFESFLSYNPEMMVCLNNLLITFKDGKLYTHDNTIQYNTFYNFSYDSSITIAANDNPALKKTFNNITQLSDDAWQVAEMTTNFKIKTNTVQSTNIPLAAFKQQEGEWNAVIPGDENTPGGLVNGSVMKGSYALIKFQRNYDNFAIQYFLNMVTIGTTESPKNNRQ